MITSFVFLLNINNIINNIIIIYYSLQQSMYTGVVQCLITLTICQNCNENISKLV